MRAGRQVGYRYPRLLGAAGETQNRLADPLGHWALKPEPETLVSVPFFFICFGRFLYQARSGTDGRRPILGYRLVARSCLELGWRGRGPRTAQNHRWLPMVAVRHPAASRPVLPCTGRLAGCAGRCSCGAAWPMQALGKSMYALLGNTMLWRTATDANALDAMM